MKTITTPLVLETTCPFCGESHSIIVDTYDYFDWIDGELVQNAFPYLSVDEREMVKTGICPTCWDDMFKDED